LDVLGSVSAELRDSCEVTQLIDGEDDSGMRTVTVVSLDGKRWSGRRVVLALGAWAGPTLERLVNVRIQLEVWQARIGGRVPEVLC